MTHLKNKARNAVCFAIKHCKTVDLQRLLDYANDLEIALTGAFSNIDNDIDKIIAKMSPGTKLQQLQIDLDTITAKNDEQTYCKVIVGILDNYDKNWKVLPRFDQHKIIL